MIEANINPEVAGFNLSEDDALEPAKNSVRPFR